MKREWEDLGGPPDVVALQEYDCDEALADYRGLGDETFAAAMEASGYEGLLFTDPLEGRVPPSGLGVFWRKAALTLADGRAVGMGPERVVRPLVLFTCLFLVLGPAHVDVALLYL